MPPVPTPASRITAGELVLVCSRYDLGAIRALRRIRGGSRESPKVLVESDRGEYLIKRRAPKGSAADLSRRVALSHEVQLHLAARGFPIAPLVGTRADNNSLLELNGSIYEVFRFVDGRRYDRTPASAHAAGRLLAVAHRLLADLHPRWTPPDTTYHRHPAVAPSINDLIAKEPDAKVQNDLAALREAYLRAADEADRFASVAPGAQVQLIHADWHPGNLLFSPQGPDATATVTPPIVAVLDFDSVRLGPPILDVANGALQFAIARRPGTQPDVRGGVGIRVSINPDLIQAFSAGYLAENPPSRLPPAELAVTPWLMIEAIIVETVAPIAATGQFGKVSAGAALAMTRQAADWMAADAGRLVSLVGGR